MILARHGETEWNAAEIFRGQADVPLNKRGEEQAQRLGEYLREEKINAICSSPLKRAMKTAGAIAERQSLAVKTAPALTDINYGKWQGLANEEAQLKYPELYKRWQNTPENVTFPGGESLEDVKKRVWPFLKETITAHNGLKVVLVSHRVVHKVLICALLEIGNAGFYRIKLDTAGITRFEFSKGQAVLIAHNDTSYLKQTGGMELTDF